MLKPALFALTGAGITASAYFSNTCPSTLAATQLSIYSLVYGLKPILNAPAHVEQFYSYIAIGTFLFLSKLFEYWTLSLAGPLMSQVAFFPVPLIALGIGRIFPQVWHFELDRWELGMQFLFLSLFPVFALARPEPGGAGIMTALVTTIATGTYTVAYSIAMTKYTDRSVVEVRALVYFMAALLAIAMGIYSIELPGNYLGFGLFAVACFAHVIIRKWHDANEGKIGGEKFAGEWSAVRAFLVLSWAWLHEWEGIVILFIAAIALHAYYFKGRRQRASGTTTLPEVKEAAKGDEDS